MSFQNCLSCLLYRGAFSFVSLAAIGTAALAGVPAYEEFELQARSNIVDGFNLPPNSTFNSATPTINDSAQIAFRLIVVGGTGESGVFLGQGGVGDVVYISSNEFLISDPSINNNGEVAFEEFDFGISNGIRVYDPKTGMSPVAVAPGGMFGATAYSGVAINDDGVIGFRGDVGFAGSRFITDNGRMQFSHAAESGVDASSPYAFLFTPNMDGMGRIAGKARSGGTGNDQPDEVRIWNNDGSSILIAEDDDANARSMFTSFDNSVSINNVGQVAFTAGLPGGGRGVFLSDGNETITIATEADPQIDDIVFFAPNVNDNGVVVFRAIDSDGLDAVFVGDGESLVRIIGEHDLIQIDLGEARIDQNDDSVTFAGAPKINNNNEIVFIATLTPADNNQIEWGTGVFVAYPSDDEGPLGDLDGDGIVNGSDLLLLLNAWGLPGNPADLDNSGTVGGGDLLILLNNWG